MPVEWQHPTSEPPAPIRRIMVRALYQILLWLALPFVPLRLWWRSRREPEYGERVGERFGRPPAAIPKDGVWFHAVSAGETIAAAPLIEALADEFPSLPFLVTTMTPTGSEQVTRRLGGKVAHCYAPYDFRFAVRAFFDAVRPRLLILVETELWPNLIGEAHRRGVPVLLVNARLSERSARGYGRFPKLTQTMLSQLGLIGCQYPDHAQRFQAIGADPAKVVTTGSVKFDVVLPGDHAPAVAALRTALGLAGRPTWIAASTHPGEEAIVLDAHQRLRERLPDLCLLLVPRHPVRSAEVLKLAVDRGFASASLSQPPSEPAAVVVCDQMGALQTLYGLSKVAFIGGSLVPRGGHNPIEAALCGQPLLMGPSDFNFTEVAAAFAKAGCLDRVRDAGELAEAVIKHLSDEPGRQQAGARALEAVRRNGGALAKTKALLRIR